jgi:putative transposase
MKFNPDIHKRRSIRLRRHDYSLPGLYFVTVCVNNRLCLFGDIIDHVMMINAAGTMIGYWWNELSNKFPNIKLDEYVVMPNHFHGIMEIQDEQETEAGRTRRCAPTVESPNVGVNRKFRANPQVRPYVGVDLRVYPLTLGSCLPDPPGASLHKILQWFKTMTTNEYIRNERQNVWPAFDKKLWQRNYYEHVIRNQQALSEMRHYIIENPHNWKDDDMFPGINNP